jgi:hypothetical protein
MSDDATTDTTTDTKTEEKKHSSEDGGCECGHCAPASALAEKMLDVMKAEHEGKNMPVMDRMSIELDAASKLLAALITECNGNVNIIIARLLWRVDVNDSIKRERESRQFMEFLKAAQFQANEADADLEDDDDKKPVTVN